MFGDTATELVRQLYKSNTLPPFNESAISRVTNEIVEIYQKLVQMLESESNDLSDPSKGGTALFYHRIILRNKRCILAYLLCFLKVYVSNIRYRLHRLYALCDSRWDQLDQQNTSEDIESHMSSSEKEFLMEYDNILSKYSEACSMDLTSLLNPPRSLFIEVRVVKDCGTIMTENGTVHLKKDTLHYLKRSDVELLIQQGYLVPTNK
eukprot:jgi/Galph1/5397/GphlegSOOS_G4022.1